MNKHNNELLGRVQNFGIGTQAYTQFSGAAVIPLIEVTAKLMTLFITLEAAEDTLDG